MRQTTITLASTLMALGTLSACSISGSSTTPSASPTDVTINTTTVKIPTGYTLAGTSRDSATSTTTTMIDAKGMPRYITVARADENFDVKTWCSRMNDSFKNSYAKDAKITQKSSATSCTIEGQGKTPASGSTSSASATPSGYSAKTLPGSTAYANFATIKKASNGAYVAMLSRHLGENVSFADDEKFFASVAK